MGDSEMVNLRRAINRLFYREYKPHRWHELAVYNSEKRRGVKHTEEWKDEMRRQQEQFNQEMRAQ